MIKIVQFMYFLLMNLGCFYFFSPYSWPPFIMWSVNKGLWQLQSPFPKEFTNLQCRSQMGQKLNSVQSLLGDFSSVTPKVFWLHKIYIKLLCFQGKYLTS